MKMYQPIYLDFSTGERVVKGISLQLFHTEKEAMEYGTFVCNKNLTVKVLEVEIEMEGIK